MKKNLVTFILRLLAKQSIASIIPWAFRSIRKLYRNDAGGYLEFLRESASRDEWIFRFFAAHEIGTLHGQYPDETLELLRTLSKADTEIVREGCAKSWSRLLVEDFESTFDVLETLARDGTYAERYTAAIAPVEYYRESSDSEHRSRISNFWERYEDDPKQGLWNLVRTQILEDVNSDRAG